jgi:hypothetical protein
MPTKAKSEARLTDRLKAIAERTPPPPQNYETTTSGRSQRTPTFKQAVLRLPHGELLPVVIKNLSKTGARVEFFQNRELAVDDRVRLSAQTAAIDRGARVIWQKQGLVGLKFTGD